MVTTEKLVLSVPEAGRMLGISRAQAYLMAKTEKIPTIKLGRRIVVPKSALEKMLANAGQVKQKDATSLNNEGLSNGQ